jgi:hypothetical protein
MPRYWATIEITRSAYAESKPTTQSKPMRRSMSFLRRMRSRGGKRTCHRLRLRNRRRKMPEGGGAMIPTTCERCHNNDVMGFMHIEGIRVFLCGTCWQGLDRRRRGGFGEPGDGTLFARE